MGLKALLARAPQDDVVIGEPAIPVVPLSEEREREFQATRDQLAADLAVVRLRIDAIAAASRGNQPAEALVVDILREAVLPPANSVTHAAEDFSHTAWVHDPNHRPDLRQPTS